MLLNPALIEALSQKAGTDVGTPEGAALLRHDIESVTGERLSLNTVKRLTGVIAYDGNPRSVTLDIIASYLGYSSVAIMEAAMQGRTSVFGADSSMVEVSALPQGTVMDIDWDPDRSITLAHEGAGVCRVVEACNSKLREGDMLQLTQLAEGFPLLVESVRRGDVDLGPFTAGRQTGISFSIRHKQ